VSNEFNKIVFGVASGRAAPSLHACPERTLHRRHTGCDQDPRLGTVLGKGYRPEESWPEQFGRRFGGQHRTSQGGTAW